MTDIRNRKPSAGSIVALIALPPGLLGDLPMEDQRAISGIVGKPIRLTKYDHDGKAELEFTDSDGQIHFIYVEPSFIVLID